MGEGNLVAGLREHGYQVEGSDIKTGNDFLVSKRNCDVIVTNPPDSLKLEFLKRCYKLGKPLRYRFQSLLWKQKRGSSFSGSMV